MKKLLLFLLASHFPIQSNNYGFIDYSEEPTALRIAARNGDVAQMKELIKIGQNVNDVLGCDQPHAGRTILVEAIDSGSKEAVKLLLDAGADIEIESEVPFSNILKPPTRNVIALSYAIMVNAPIEIIGLLIQYSKNLNIPDFYYDWTPYKIATYYKNYAAMELLANAGADIGATFKSKQYV